MASRKRSRSQKREQRSTSCSTCGLKHPENRRPIKRIQEQVSDVKHKQQKRQDRISRRKVRKNMDLLRFCGKVAYDGNKFHGFQRQTFHGVWNIPTIQLILEEAFSKALGLFRDSESLIGASDEFVFASSDVGAVGVDYGKDTEIVVTGSSRTDSGVHAAGQVFHVDIPTKFIENFTFSNLKEGAHHHSSVVCDKLLKLANEKLRKSAVTIKGLKVIDRTFDVSRNSIGKRYTYVIFDGVRNPKIDAKMEGRFLDIYGGKVRQHNPDIVKPLNTSAMNECANAIAGTERDFRAFTRSAKRCAKATSSPERTRRILYRCGIRRVTGDGFGSAVGNDPEAEGGFILFEVEGNGFLYLMVRCLVSALLKVGKGELTIQDITEDALNPGPDFDPGMAFSPAPPHGLCLERVYYGQDVLFDEDDVPDWYNPLTSADE